MQDFVVSLFLFPYRAWIARNLSLNIENSTSPSWIFNWYSGIIFFLCGQKEETRKNREHAPPSNKWAFLCLAAELAASPLRQSSPETTPKSLICYRRLPLSFAQPTPRHLAWQTCEAVLIMTSSFRIGLNLRNLKKLKITTSRWTGSRSAYWKQVFVCFNGLYTPFGSPVIGGQKRSIATLCFAWTGSRSAYWKQVFVCFNGLYTPLG